MEGFRDPSSDFSINGIQDYSHSAPLTHASHGVWTSLPNSGSKVIIVGNANCASTYSAFTTLMQELRGVKIVNFDIAKGADSGMAEAELLECDALDSEFKVSTLQYSSTYSGG
jgi:hypothetical protein